MVMLDDASLRDLTMHGRTLSQRRIVTQICMGYNNLWPDVIKPGMDQSLARSD